MQNLHDDGDFAHYLRLELGRVRLYTAVELPAEAARARNEARRLIAKERRRRAALAACA